MSLHRPRILADILARRGALRGTPRRLASVRRSSGRAQQKFRNRTQGPIRGESEDFAVRYSSARALKMRLQTECKMPFSHLSFSISPVDKSFASRIRPPGTQHLQPQERHSRKTPFEGIKMP